MKINKRNKKKSLKRILITNIFVAVIIPITIFNIIIFYYLGNHYSKTIQDNLVTSTELVGTEISFILKEYEEVIGNLLELLDNNMIYEDSIQQYLKYMISDYNFLERIEVLDTSGNITYIEPYKGDYIGISMSGKDYFKTEDRVYWSNTFVSPYSGKTTINVSIKGKKNIIVGYVNLSMLKEIVSIATKDNYIGYIIDRTQNVIISTDNENLIHRQNILDLTSINHNEKVTLNKLEDVNKLKYIRTLYEIPETEWYVELIAFEKDIVRPVRNSTFIFIISLILLFDFLIISLYRLLKKVINPINMLKEKADEVTKGNYNIPINFESDIDEISSLTTDFKTMISKIKERTEDLEQFVYVSSHDLQEPLRMVTVYMQILQEKYKDKLDKDAEKYIFYAVDGAKRMRNLIQDLLAYSRSGKDIERMDLVDLNTVIENIKRNLKVYIKENNATINNRGLPKVYGDKLRFEQLFQNLINNSIKYRKEIDPIINIGFIENDDCYKIYVEDNGIGIDRKYLVEVFKVFRRLHTKEKYPGTGIGLAICEKIVSKIGGKIYIVSEINEGATVYIELQKINTE